MLSAGLHLFLVIAIIVVGLVHTKSGMDWGGSATGEAITANIVSAVPLPAPQEPTKNIVATENKGLTNLYRKKRKKSQTLFPFLTSRLNTSRKKRR